MYYRTAELCTTQCVVCTCMVDYMCRQCCMMIFHQSKLPWQNITFILKYTHTKWLKKTQLPFQNIVDDAIMFILNASLPYYKSLPGYMYTMVQIRKCDTLCGSLSCNCHLYTRQIDLLLNWYMTKALPPQMSKLRWLKSCHLGFVKWNVKVLADTTELMFILHNVHNNKQNHVLSVTLASHLFQTHSQVQHACVL